ILEQILSSLVAEAAQMVEEYITRQAVITAIEVRANETNSTHGFVDASGYGQILFSGDVDGLSPADGVVLAFFHCDGDDLTVECVLRYTREIVGTNSRTTVYVDLDSFTEENCPVCGQN
ncbi:hypothetical protein H5P28_15555, partial [Ruficoccus amylovorans]